MGQRHYTWEQVDNMTNEELAGELEFWAFARESASESRKARGKGPLDTKLLEEAAARLRCAGQRGVPMSDDLLARLREVAATVSITGRDGDKAYVLNIGVFSPEQVQRGLERLIAQLELIVALDLSGERAAMLDAFIQGARGDA